MKEKRCSHITKDFLGGKGRKFLLPLREFMAYTEIQLRPHIQKWRKYHMNYSGSDHILGHVAQSKKM
jgi:hypothetical protein